MDRDALSRLEEDLGGPASSAPPPSDAALLRQALIDEKASPELLPHKEELVARIREQIEYQEVQAEEARERADMELPRAAWAAELARVRYVLRAYLRARLHKIERHVMAVLDDPRLKARLSARELDHAQEYFVLLGGHLKAAVASRLPPAFSSLVRQAAAHPDKDMVPAPKLDSHVFCRVAADLGAVEVDSDGSLAEFAAGDLYVVRYRPIRDLVASGEVHLL